MALCLLDEGLEGCSRGAAEIVNRTGSATAQHHGGGQLLNGAVERDAARHHVRRIPARLRDRTRNCWSRRLVRAGRKCRALLTAASRSATRFSDLFLCQDPPSAPRGRSPDGTGSRVYSRFLRRVVNLRSSPGYELSLEREAKALHMPEQLVPVIIQEMYSVK